MFAVVWHRQTLDDLQKIRGESSAELFETVREAVKSMESQLRNDPFNDSESRDDDRRILFSAPVGHIFRVDNRLQLVTVSPIWCYRRRN